MRPVLLVAFVAIVVGGCSSSTEAGQVAGEWAEVFNVGGLSTDMTLRTSGSVVSGSGTWCGEIIPCGTLAVTGTAVGSIVHLEIAFSNGSTQVFDGRLVGAASLVGKMKLSTGPESFDVMFRRVIGAKP